MLAVFRCDASTLVGGGHIRRCMALGDALCELGWQTVFCIPKAGAVFSPWLGSRDRIEISVDADIDPSALQRLLPEGCDLVVLDHYGLPASYASSLRGWARRIMVIDDLAAHPHDCDVLLDHNAGRGRGDYTGLVPKNAALLTGPGFALLDPAYARARSRALAQTESPRCFVNLGAGDQTDTLLKVLKGLPRELPVTVVAGAMTRETELREQIAVREESRFHRQVDAATMASLMQSCGWAVGAGGVSALERCTLGLPTLITEIASNQHAGTKALAEAGAAIALGSSKILTARRLKDAVSRFDANARGVIGGMAASLCDGIGARRVAAWLDRLVHGKSCDVMLRQASRSDSEIMFAWQTEPGTRRYSRNPEPPRRGDHQAWFEAKLRQPNCIFNVIEFHNTPVGVVRLDGRGENVYEMSINVAASHQGRGIASAALDLALKLVSQAQVKAAVLADNVASMALFRKAGFQPIGEGWLGHTGVLATH